MLDRLGSDSGSERAAAGLIAAKMVHESGASWAALLSGIGTELRQIPLATGGSWTTDIKANRMSKFQAKAWLDQLDLLGGMTEAEQRFVWVTWKRLTSEPGSRVTVGEQQQLRDLYSRRVTPERVRAYRRRTAAN
ncbi:hypothetical protein [Roseococcus sp.]|uniref:hypothetical protein n=1 Tax=Roseococcus sp. TaxID=2109646 RepID=UPI003BA87093